jgi:hypothetical protein
VLAAGWFGAVVGHGDRRERAALLLGDRARAFGTARTPLLAVGDRGLLDDVRRDRASW